MQSLYLGDIMKFNSKYLKIERNDSRYFTFTLSSGDAGDTTASLHAQIFGYWVDLRLPRLVCPPMRVKLYQNWDIDTIVRLGRDLYWKDTRREFSITLIDEHCIVRYGIQSDNVSRSILISLGWKMWNYVGIDYIDTDNKTILRNYPQCKFTDPMYAQQQEFKNSMPSETHTIIDFDGESISVKCRIEQRTWYKGDGAFKWLRYVSKPLVLRQVDLWFSHETGAHKSYKGGTIGASVEIFAGERIVDALKRYCDEHGMQLPIIDV